jgi:predicted nucleic acid-binding protein
VRLLLNTAVLGEVCHPRKYVEVRAWLARAVAHHDVLISEVADYELRRELLRIGSHRSLDRLDELTRELTYVPMATSTWRAAAKLFSPPERGVDGHRGLDREFTENLLSDTRVERTGLEMPVLGTRPSR